MSSSLRKRSISVRAPPEGVTHLAFVGQSLVASVKRSRGRPLMTSAHELVRAVQVGHVDEADALIEAVPHEAVEGFFALPRVGRRMVIAVETGALGQPRDLDAGAAQGDHVGAVEPRSGLARLQQAAAGRRQSVPASEACKKCRRV